MRYEAVKRETAAPDRYARLSITLHWLMLALLIAVYACIELREIFPRGSDPREALKTWHFMLGISVFFLVWLRLAARLVGVTPPIVPPVPQWQRVLARCVHAALYALMIVLPLLGWLALSAKGKAVPFFSWQLPALTAPDKSLAGTVEELHESLATAGYFVIGLHAAAALFHHYWQRDNTLRRMLWSR
jgi:cytochrome b561